MLTKSLGSIVFATVLFCSFNTQAHLQNVNTELIKNQEVSVACDGIIEIVQIGRHEVLIEVNQAPTTIRLIDAEGTVVSEDIITSVGLFILNVSTCDSGTYTLEAIHETVTQTETIIIK